MGYFACVVMLAAGTVWAASQQEEASKSTEITATGMVTALYPGLKAEELQDDAKLLAELNAIAALHITTKNGKSCDELHHAMVGMVPLEATRDLWLGTENRGKSVEFTGVLNERTQQVRIQKFTIQEEDPWNSLLSPPGGITNQQGL
tara:strand:+ start:3228 stop:3668 length:441 start_codon:yes stop_codon:yes gene_type:complete